MEELKRRCFFCSEVIEGKKTMEHIIPNGLLGRLGIKEVSVTGERETQYSRIKVPSHALCNNGFGSKYEEKILELLDDTDVLYETLREEENSLPMIYQADESATAIITTWLSKIYYGLFYDDYLKTKDESWKEICSSIIENDNFNLVRKSYKNGLGFQLPSSLYVFKTNNTQSDLDTFVYPSGILLKVKSLTLILCICDGYLTKNYLFGDSLEKLREHISELDIRETEFPSHRVAYAEILALSACIPKTPRFIYSKNQIVNMSFSTMSANPEELYEIDTELFNEARLKMLSYLKITFDATLNCYHWAPNQ